jgi:hypothetical protein
MNKLHIEKTSSDNYYDYFTVDGLSVAEMNEIITAPVHGKDQRDVLVEVMNRHENDSPYGKNIASAWRCGYGIYHIGHVGGHLFVEVGNSCD